MRSCERRGIRGIAPGSAFVTLSICLDKIFETSDLVDASAFGKHSPSAANGSLIAS